MATTDAPLPPRAASSLHHHHRASTTRKRLLPGATFLSFLFVLAASVPAQGDFVNFEVPECKSVDVARVGDHDYLLVCNTPDNSVEIYDTHTLRRIQRVPVGQGPVTVRYNPFLNRFFTCNYMGDSVTRVRLFPPKDGDGPHPTAFVEQTAHVGDEPCDLGFTRDQQTFFVTLASRSAVG